MASALDGQMNEQQNKPVCTRCALCLETRPLCDSHVISEFLYHSLYDQKHRFHFLAAGEYPAFEQKGLREALLCQSCETKLSVWEKYVSSVFAGNEALQFTPGNEVTWVNGIDYKRFKLFQLSILWRAGVAAGKFFERVKLGPHQEYIRSMLLNEDPGGSNRYGCLMWALHLKGEPASSIIQPTKVSSFPVRAYRFTFGGFLWVFTVASNNLPKSLQPALLQESGQLLVGQGNVEDADFINQLMMRVRI